LDDLLTLQSALFQQNPSTASLPAFQKPDRRKAAAASSSGSGSGAAGSGSGSGSGSGGLSALYWPAVDVASNSSYQKQMRAVIQTWNDRTQLASGKATPHTGALSGLKVINQSVVSQIDSVLLDTPQLIRRTQLKRLPYKILGSNKRKRDELNADSAPASAASASAASTSSSSSAAAGAAGSGAAALLDGREEV
jgi:hypothetical protein